MKLKKLFEIFTAFAVSLSAAAVFGTASLSVNAAEIADPVYDEYDNVVIPSEPLVERVVDQAQLLSDEELQDLLEAADEVSERQGIDVCIVTSEDLSGRSTSTEFADDYFDYNGLGQSESHDGILFAISMENRDWAISTTGIAIDYFTDYGQEQITDRILPYLSDGDYYEAFDMFIEFCDDYITQGKEGDPYDIDNEPTVTKIPFKEALPSMLKKCLLISLAIGFAVTLVICLIEKHKLTSVQFKGQADDYIRKDSLNITGKSDTFLYKNTTKRYNPPSSSSSGGSSTHSGSSGVSHGGSSGHF